MMFLDEEQEASQQGRTKTLVLASRCGWLQRVLAEQDRVLALADALAASGNDSAWARQSALLQQAVDRHFRLEEMVFAAAVDRTGLRAQAVLADASRRRILRDLEALDALSWREGRTHAERLRFSLDSHFQQEQSCSYRPLARQLRDEGHDALTRRCQSAIRGEAR